MIDTPILDYLRELNVISLIVRYVLAMICGGLIGIEREKKHRPAGFRTHILVCVGSATAFIIGQYLVEQGYATDISRLAAQVISGIGFLGAGTIIVTRQQQIKGLTTAAGLWASACVGLAIGSGFYEAAIICTLLIVIIAAVLIKINRFMTRGSKYLRLYVEFSAARYIGEFLDTMREMNVYIFNIEMDKNTEGQMSILIAELECPTKDDHSELLERIKGMEGVEAVEVL